MVQALVNKLLMMYRIVLKFIVQILLTVRLYLHYVHGKVGAGA
jgi:hypothetical protein